MSKKPVKNIEVKAFPVWETVTHKLLGYTPYFCDDDGIRGFTRVGDRKFPTPDEAMKAYVETIVFQDKPGTAWEIALLDIIANAKDGDVIKVANQHVADRAEAFRLENSPTKNVIFEVVVVGEQA